MPRYAVCRVLHVVSAACGVMRLYIGDYAVVTQGNCTVALIQKREKRVFNYLDSFNRELHVALWLLDSAASYVWFGYHFTGGSPRVHAQM